MSEAQIKTFLFGRLARVYGQPRNADGLAAELARYVPVGASDEALEALAGRIVETRKAKGFPAAAELITLVRSISVARPTSVQGSGFVSGAEIAERERAEDAAVRTARGTGVARKAVAEHWAPALVSFIRRERRMPDFREISDCIAISRRNDALAAESGGMAEKLRKAMHEAAERDLGHKAMNSEAAA
jgi:hypothetical protein